MILRFRHKGLERFFTTGDARGISTQHAEWIRVLLTTLNVSTNPAGMNLPGMRLHPLKGKRKGKWAVSVSANWRLVFEFDGENATNVDLVDYH
ncbi:MAG: type II toxin-antitoxin system RelE/ParE family toxin [SAR324 cluster bacterium]